MKKRSSRRPRVARRKRFARKRPTTLVNRALHPIPARFITKHKYCEAINTDAGGGYIMNLNSLYDPNRTGTGHQPYGFDNLALLYNRYRVISCRWVLTSPNTAQVRQLGSVPSNDSGMTFPIFSTLKEQSRAQFVTHVPGAPAPLIKGSCYLPALMGRTKAQYMADDQYASVVTGSPAELALLYIQTATASDAYDPTATVQVTLEYTVEWFDVKHFEVS